MTSLVKRPVKILGAIREFLWPRMGWARAGRYYMYRVRRLTATPHAIAIGFACGAFASFTPFMGFHLLLCIGLAYVLRGHLVASVIGTVVGNPLTFPMIWLATYNFGKEILGVSGSSAYAERSFDNSQSMMDLLTGSFDQAWPVISSMTIGGLALGIPVAVLCYIIVRCGVAGFQRKRRNALSNVTARQLRGAKVPSPNAG